MKIRWTRSALAAVGCLALIFSGCTKEQLVGAGRGAGLLDSDQHPFDLIILCDASEYSTCQADTLRATLERLVLPAAASRPGSQVRLYTLGEDVVARLVATRESTPAKRQSAKAILHHEVEWRRDALGFFTTAAAPVFASGPAQQSRIAEALTRLANADHLDGAHRFLIVISDLRETGIAKLEHGPVPAPREFLDRLTSRELLTSESLRGVRVLFTNTSINTPIAVQADTPARSQEIKELWRTAINHAGGVPEFYDQLPRNLERN